MSDVRSSKKINENISFEDLMNSDWEKTIPYDADGAGVRVDDGVLFTISEIWDEYKPMTHSMSKEDVTKMYNVLYYSKDMFNLLRDMDDDRARDLINRILNDRNKPEIH
jgi:hypothetical protein